MIDIHQWLPRCKGHIWSISERQVVDWNDLHKMVTAACYTPDGQGALVGSYKGSCHLYNISDNKLQQKAQIKLQNQKKTTHQRKTISFQFVPGSMSQVLITSADSRIWVVDGADLFHKFTPHLWVPSSKYTCILIGGPDNCRKEYIWNFVSFNVVTFSLFLLF